MGGIYWCSYNVYLGVVNGCCCKEVYRYPHNITYPYSTCISAFFTEASLYTFCSFLKCVFVILLNILMHLIVWKNKCAVIVPTFWLVHSFFGYNFSF